MRPGTFAGIEARAFDKLRAEGIGEDQARERARATAGAAYWRAAVKKYTIATIGGKMPARKERKKGKPEKNPVLAIMGNPPGRVFSNDVHAILYTHADDGEYYRHDFAGGVRMTALADGSVLIHHPGGKPVWRNIR